MNCIRYNDKTKVFVLETENSMYQMCVGEHDTLIHLYYGANVGETEIISRWNSTSSEYDIKSSESDLSGFQIEISIAFYVLVYENAEYDKKR